MNKVSKYDRYRWKPFISKEKFKKLYITEGLSINQIAKRYNVTINIAYNLIKKYKIPRRIQTSNLFGKNSPHWKGGIIIKEGYKLISKKDYPRNWNGYVQEHILIMEKQLKRKLKYYGKSNPKNEVVHHIDKNKLNNDIKNLKLMTLHEHIKHHSKYS